MWDSRYAADEAEYVYGIEPNDFLAASVTDLPKGNVLCLADGEGRNGVYLASLGHTVTSVDLSAAGLVKAAKLAEENGVALETVVADLADFEFGENRWDLIVSIFAHTPPLIRRRVHAAIADALRPGGAFVLEAFTPDQIGRGTGGPPVAEMMMTLVGLRSELEGMTIQAGEELVRPVLEGVLHTGDGAVVQIIATTDNYLSSVTKETIS